MIFRLTPAKGLRWLSWIDLNIDGTQLHQGKYDQGHPCETLSIGRDVTERKNIETDLKQARDEALSASEAKSQFLATVSHELRTPLNGVIGMAGLLDDGTLRAEQKSYIDVVRNCGTSLLALIDDLLDFAKIEAGKVKLEQKPMSITQLIDNVCELMAPKAHEKNLELGSYIDPLFAQK